MEPVDTELRQLNLCSQLRANSSFMKVIATLFYYGNQTMNAGQLVVAVRALDLLPLRGETPKSTIQGIISTARKTARDLKKPDPFRIEKDGTGRQAKYCISDDVLNGAAVPVVQDIPDHPIHLKPVEYGSHHSYANHTGKRARKPRSTSNKAKRRRDTNSNAASGGDSDASEVDIDTDEEFGLGVSDDETKATVQHCEEEDTIFDYSLLYSPPETDDQYIDAINFASYPVASYFAIVQQKGYSYPRFRSHEKIKIPKVRCEDKYRVADIMGKDNTSIVGRVFILADGHGGPGCAEYFVRHTPAVIQQLCNKYDPEQIDDMSVQQQMEHDIKQEITALDEKYLNIKRLQLGQKSYRKSNGHPAPPTQVLQTPSSAPAATIDTSGTVTEEEEEEEETQVDNDGCTLIVNIFFGTWMINVNVGDSRSILISAPEPGSSSPSSTAAQTVSTSSASTSPYVTPPGGFDKDYMMDVVFASQDHKPYLEHLVREILENGGEFVDSVQNRVIKVELDKLREDGNRQAKRFALKNARIRPKGYQAGQDYSNGDSTPSWTAQSAVRTTVNPTETQHQQAATTATESSSSSSPPPLSSSTTTSTSALSPPSSSTPQPSAAKTLSLNNDTRSNGGRPRSRHDYAPSLNVARSCGDLDFKMNSKKKIISCEPDVTFIRISDQLPSEMSNESNRTAAESLSIAPRTLVSCGPNKARKRNFLFMSTDGTFDYMYEETPERQNRAIAKVLGPLIEDGEKIGKYLLEEEERSQTIQHVDKATNSERDSNGSLDTKMSPKKKEDNNDSATPVAAVTASTNGNEANGEKKERKPLLYRELSESECKVRNTKEKTLVTAARYFANREGAHGFFSSTLQDYDDCTILLIEI